MWFLAQPFGWELLLSLFLQRPILRTQRFYERYEKSGMNSCMLQSLRQRGVVISLEASSQLGVGAGGRDLCAAVYGVFMPGNKNNNLLIMAVCGSCRGP